MTELISTRDIKNLKEKLPTDRHDFYTSQFKKIDEGGKADRAVDVVALLLFTSDGHIILQKRSHTKRHNPYLIDKSVGGHIKYGDTPLYTLMVETVQELQVPSIVLRTYNDFIKTYTLLHTYLDSIAIVKELDRKVYAMNRVVDGKKYQMLNNAYVYIGVYGGATKPVDQEASGILFYDLDVLKKEMEKKPESFPYDLRFYLEKYQYEIQTFLNYLSQPQLLTK